MESYADGILREATGRPQGCICLVHDQSNEYSAAAVLLSGYGLVSMWDTGLTDIYFV